MFFRSSRSFRDSGGRSVPVEALVECCETRTAFGGIPDGGVEGKVGGAESMDCAFRCGVSGRELGDDQQV